MKYMLLIFSNPENWAALTEAETKDVMDEYWAFSQRITESGEFVSGEPLQGPDTGYRRAGQRREPGDQSTGRSWRARSTSPATTSSTASPSTGRSSWLRSIPDARLGGAIEVRPVADFPSPA